MKDYHREETKFVLFKTKTIGSKVATPITGIYDSIKSGTIGFFIVFLFILITKLLCSIIKFDSHFSIGINDFILSIWGFLILSFIVFMSKNSRLK